MDQMNVKDNMHNTDADTKIRHTQSLDENEHDRTCPICLIEIPPSKTGDDNVSQSKKSSSLMLLSGPCGHCFCQPCLERLLNSPSSSGGSFTSTDDAALLMDTAGTTATAARSFELESVMITPTLGVCPICRARLSLFDLKCSDTNKVAYPRNSNWSPLAGFVFVDATEGKMEAGYGSFHFPSPPADPSSTSESARPTVPTVPYMSLEKVVSLLHGSNSHYPMYVPFCQYNYHADTRTFTGSLDFATGPFARWDVYLTFSSSLRFVARGLIHKIRRRPAEQGGSAGDMMYPLDGRWWVEEHGGAITYENHVTAGSWKTRRNDIFSVRSNRDQNRIEMVYAYRPTNGVFRNGGDEPTDATSLLASWDWEEHPEGPAVGSSIEWRQANTGGTDEPISDAEKTSQVETLMRWTRLSIRAEPLPDSIDRIGGTSLRRFQRMPTTSRQSSLPRSNQKPVYRNESIWGNVFCQAFKVGLASYHFESPPGQLHDHDATNTTHNEPIVYISYEHPATGQWPPLDNGTPIPSRVYFHNISFPTPHTFRGQIRWLEDYGTCWQGFSRWDYEMQFDSEYMCITSGFVKSLLGVYEDGLDRDGDTSVTRSMPSPAAEHGNESSHYSNGEPNDDPHTQNQYWDEMSRYGETLVYCNAGLFDHFRQLSTNEDYAAYRRLSEELRTRLGVDEGTTSVRSFAQIHRLLTAAQQPDENEEGNTEESSSSSSSTYPYNSNPMDYNIL